MKIMNMTGQKNKNALRHRILTIIGIVLCVILVPVLIMNLTLLAKSWTNKEKVPDIGGYLPLIVLTDSMEGVINSGDLIICHSAKPEDIKVGDIISFFDPDGNGTSIVTHRVEEVVVKDGNISFITKGDANNTRDRLPVPAENLVGIYETRLQGFGRVAMFMQTTQGSIVCVGIPLFLLLGYDILRRRKYEKSKQQDADVLMAELEALKAEKARVQSERAKSDEEKSDRTEDPSSGDNP